jgi:hypothetical protein
VLIVSLRCTRCMPDGIVLILNGHASRNQSFLTQIKVAPDQFFKARNALDLSDVSA